MDYEYDSDDENENESEKATSDHPTDNPVEIDFPPNVNSHDDNSNSTIVEQPQMNNNHNNHHQNGTNEEEEGAEEQLTAGLKSRGLKLGQDEENDSLTSSCHQIEPANKRARLENS